jgi:hypothetical protein
MADPDWVRLLDVVRLAASRLGAGRGVAAAERAFEEVRALATPGAERDPSPVIVLAGGSSPRVEGEMERHRELVLAAFRYFAGTIVSGGTAQGIGELAGDVREEYGGRIRTVGYVPRLVPADAVVDRDPRRYDELRVTEGDSFSPLQPVQGWIDLVASGVHPAEVKLLGIGGGAVAAAELRMALALGASVAVIEGSGGAAAQLLGDDDWAGERRLVALPHEPRTVLAWVESEPAAARLPAGVRERIGSAVHERYRADQAGRKAPRDPAVADWDELDEDRKESSREQGDHLFAKLRRLGYEIEPAAVGTAPPDGFPPDHVGVMAGWEHRRWNHERLLAGWTWAPQRDPARKTTPYLTPWEELPEQIREYDREAIRAIPSHLRAAGLGIAPAPPGR